MAINISTPIVTVDGILLNTSYGRIQIANEFSGKKNKCNIINLSS
jgi:hypothetical protein